MMLSFTTTPSALGADTKEYYAKNLSVADVERITGLTGIKTNIDKGGQTPVKKLQTFSIILGLLSILSLSAPLVVNGASPVSHKLVKTEAWKGVFTVKVTTNVEVNRTDLDALYQSVINETATYDGVCLSGFSYLPGTAWEMKSGSVTIRMNDETYEISGDTKTRSTNQANQTLDVAQLAEGNITIILSQDKPTYALVFPRTPVTVSTTLYAPNQPDSIFQGPDDNRWHIPGCEIKDIALPATGDKLTGSRKVKVMVDPPGGDGVETEAEFSWNIQTTIPLNPLMP